MTFWSSHIQVLRTWAEYSHILCQTKTGMASRPVYNRIYTHTHTKHIMSQASPIHVSLDISVFHHNGPLISAYSSISSYKLVPKPMNHMVRFIPTMTQPSTTIFCISYFPHCCNLIHDAKQCKQAQLYFGLPLPFEGIPPLLQGGHGSRRRNDGSRKRPSCYVLHYSLRAENEQEVGSGCKDSYWLTSFSGAPSPEYSTAFLNHHQCQNLNLSLTPPRRHTRLFFFSPSLSVELRSEGLFNSEDCLSLAFLLRCIFCENHICLLRQ